ncbi:hypothetical protein BV20DRAFT_960755 [Pilatotrama ljubarskyi]|nr:hypothetical protein BV20DRAFT_960755 [Pilatotrama ljubarskyi]
MSTDGAQRTVPASGRWKRRYEPQTRCTPELLAVISVLIKEREQLREAVRACEAAEARVEKLRNEPLARQCLEQLLRDIKQDGMRPHHVQELRGMLENFPDEDAAPLKEKVRDYETRRLLQLARTPANP